MENSNSNEQGLTRRNSWKQWQGKTGLLSDVKPTALEAIQSTDILISGQVKELGEARVEMILTSVLFEVFGLTLSPANEGQLAAMARQIRTNFWHYRLEEIIFVLNRGINGGYGKLFGHLSYVQISEWLQMYDVEREEAIVEERKRIQSLQRDDMKSWGVDFQPMIDKLKQGQHEAKQAQPLDIVTRDRQQLAFVQAFADELTPSELEQYISEAGALGFNQTADYLKSKVK